MLEGSLERFLDVSRRAADQRGDEIARGDVQQAHLVLACDRPGEERLADAGRAVQQDAVPVDPVALSVVRVLEHQADCVAHFLLQLIHPADVGERRQLLRRLDLELAAAVARHPHPAEHPERAHRRRALRARARLPLPSTRLSLGGRGCGYRLRRLLAGHVDPLARLRIDPVRACLHAADHLLEDPAERKDGERRDQLLAAVTLRLLEPPLLFVVGASAPGPGHAADHGQYEHEEEDEE